MVGYHLILIFAVSSGFLTRLSLCSYCTYSEGCAAAVKRILGKIEGVNDIQTNVEAKTVVVQANESVSPALMLEKLQKVSTDYFVFGAYF